MPQMYTNTCFILTHIPIQIHKSLYAAGGDGLVEPRLGFSEDGVHPPIKQTIGLVAYLTVTVTRHRDAILIIRLFVAVLCTITSS